MDPLKALRHKWKRALILGLAFYLILLTFTYLSKGDEAARKAIMARLELNPMLRILRSLLRGKQYYLAMHLIFLNNFVLVCFVYLTLPSFIPGLGVLVLLFQAYNLGVYMGVMRVFESMSTVIRMMPILTMESIAYILVTTSGLDIGISILKPELISKSWKSRGEALIMMLTELCHIYLIAAIILYLAAALEILLIIHS